MHITIDGQAATVRAGTGLFGVAQLMEAPAVRAAWRDFSAFKTVSIPETGNAAGVRFGTPGKQTTESETLNLAALRTAILASPPVVAWVDGRAEREAKELAAAVGAECSRRIYAVMSDNTQKNITAYATDLSLRLLTEVDTTEEEDADIVTARAARQWVQDMIERCREIIAAPQDFKSDAAWPPLPDGVVELAARF